MMVKVRVDLCPGVVFGGDMLVCDDGRGKDTLSTGQARTSRRPSDRSLLKDAGHARKGQRCG